MQDFIFDIYKYAQLIPAIKEIIDYCYEYDHDKVNISWKDIQFLLPEFCRQLAKENKIELAKEIMDCAEKACTYTTTSEPNFILMGDKLSECIPLLEEGMRSFAEIDVTEGKYRLLSSKSGFLALENIENGRVYNSLLDPMREAYQKAKSLYSTSITEVHIAGCDLGYLAWELLLISDMSIDIYIYHCDENVVNYAIDYGLLDWIAPDKLHIMVDREDKIINKLASVDYSKNYVGFVMLSDFVDSVSKERIDEIMKFTVLASARVVFGEESDINFWRNIKNADKNIYDIPCKEKGSEWMVIVAGPSLDESIDYIKSNMGNMKTIAATTVYSKLLKNGIVPDYLIVCDPQERTYGHMQGIACFEPALLYAATANWRFAEYYEGRKYLIPCDSSMLAKTYFKAEKIETIGIEGTVAYGAVQMAIALGAKVVHLVGLDLAYPGAQSHASDTMDSKTVEDANMVLVPCVNGGMVKTTAQFQYYIECMERLFVSHKGVKFINHSTIGARFNGSVRIQK